MSKECQGCKKDHATFKLVFANLDDEFCCDSCLINIIQEDPNSLEKIERVIKK
jgi:hypothetical protein